MPRLYEDGFEWIERHSTPELKPLVISGKRLICYDGAVSTGGTNPDEIDRHEPPPTGTLQNAEARLQYFKLRANSHLEIFKRVQKNFFDAAQHAVKDPQSPCPWPSQVDELEALAREVLQRKKELQAIKTEIDVFLAPQREAEERRKLEIEQKRFENVILVQRIRDASRIFTHDELDNDSPPRDDGEHQPALVGDTTDDKSDS